MSAGCDVIFIRNPKYRFGSSFDRVSDFNLDPTVQFTTVNVVNCKSGNYNCTIYAVLYNILVMVVVMKSIDNFLAISMVRILHTEHTQHQHSNYNRGPSQLLDGS